MTRSNFKRWTVGSRLRARATWATSLSALFALGLLLTVVGGASAAATLVPLGTAANFAVLAGTGVTNVPPSSITGSVGVSPTTGASMTALSCAEVSGTIYSVDATPVLPCRVTDATLLGIAKNDLSTAYDNAAGQTPDTTYPAGENQLGSLNLVPGVYRFGHGTTANLIGNLTLTGDANSVWVFQATSDLVTATSNTITLSGGAQACNVF